MFTDAEVCTSLGPRGVMALRAKSYGGPLAKLVRLASTDLSEETRGRSAEGVVAYSGVCTHTGCDITLWKAESIRFRCPCHESEFDPKDAGRVVGGPAPRRLPRVPVKVVDGVPVAAAGFLGRPGFQPT
jgi:Rieske Fe-S protein